MPSKRRRTPLADARERNRALMNELHGRERLEQTMSKAVAQIDAASAAIAGRPLLSDAELIGVAAAVLTEGLMSPARRKLLEELERRGVWKRS